MNVLKALLRSRKVWLAVIAAAQTIIFTLLPDFPPAVWQAIDAVIVAVIAGIAVEDAAEKVGKNNVKILPAGLEGPISSLKGTGPWMENTVNAVDPPSPSVRAWTPPEPEPVAGVETDMIRADPSPISPVGFAMLSGIVGMASGMILAPWLERWYDRIKKDEE